MPTILIDSLDDPRVELYRGLTLANRTRWSGRFIAEGPLVVERLFRSDYAVESVLLSDRRLASLGPKFPDEALVYVMPHAMARELLGFKFHTGVLACGLRRPAPSLDAILGAGSPVRLTFVVCDQVADQENMGAIVRHCAAFGADALLLGAGCADPFSRRVLRVSMGNAFFLPILETTALTDELAALRDNHGFEVAATVLDDSAEPLSEAQRANRTALLLGNEGDGLADELIALSDRKLTIPMNPGTDSLNVATTAAIALYHLTRVV